MAKTGIYARVSTTKQSTDRQIQESREFIDNDAEREEAKIYADVESGASISRDGIDELIQDIKSGKITKVVTWEYSRVARNFMFGIEFINLCIDEGVEIVTVNDMFPRIHGDGDVMDEMIGKFVAWMMDFNRQMTIERIQSGVDAAIDKGKWVGRPPFGFDTDEDGYLVIEPEDYVRMQTALEQAMLTDKSVNKLAKHHGVPQSTLNRAIKDEDRRKMYLYGEADDDRVDDAIDDDHSRQTDIGQIESRLSELEAKIDDN